LTPHSEESRYHSTKSEEQTLSEKPELQHGGTSQHQTRQLIRFSYQTLYYKKRKLKYKISRIGFISSLNCYCFVIHYDNNIRVRGFYGEVIKAYILNFKIPFSSLNSGQYKFSASDPYQASRLKR